ncbi:MAG: DNA-binding response regulator, AraC family [Ferruginibacter sp.]|uniref:ATP-binding protein n=1 Tax=Ferruginibacter sp. TaxID=1940288 RepID=UPI00265950E8|nr:ATP-binding protein [Ferruginibacter sp.]MDB5279348.1 DNA-binding response regulator, AraC family [Ferruginibacter sp.]
MKQFYFILSFICLQLNVHAQQHKNAASIDSFYAVDAKVQLHDLRPATFAFADATNQLTIGEIASGKMDDQFKPISNFKTLENYTTYWLRLSVETTGLIDKWWLLFRGTSEDYYVSNSEAVFYNFVDVYYFNKDRKLLEQNRSGMLVPRSQKQIKSLAGISRVLFSANQDEQRIIYIKMYSKLGGNAPPYLELHKPAILLPSGTGDERLSMQGGIVFTFSIFSICLFFFLRDKSYLFFGIYAFVLSIIYLTIYSRLPFIDWLVPEHPELLLSFWLLNLAAMLIFFLLFGRTFINLPVLSKRTDQFLKAFIVLWCTVVLIEIIASAISHKYVYFHYSDLSFAVITFLFVIRFAFFKNVFARFFVAGGVWLLCFTVVGIVDNEFKFMPFSPFAIGQLGQILIFAVALAYKIKLNEQAKAEADNIKDIDDIKSRFFANISHEFRTPLTLIQGPLQKIEEQANEKSKSGYTEVPLRQINTMRRHTDRLLELVNQLLDLSRLDSGKMKMQVIKGDVMQIIRVLAASFESMAERKQIHYYVHLPEQTTITFFDKDKLEKIITNLLGNAFKYTPEKGSVSLNVECDESRIRFEVDDSGPGISKKDLAKVFDRFYQVEGTEDKGTGIGLALVKELVDLYGGQISVSSEPGKGTRFKVSLPVGKNAFNENEMVYGEWKNNEIQINKGYEESLESRPVFKSGYVSELPLVLIVEDNDDLRQFIYETIEKDFQVIEAAHGKEGYEKAIAEIPDLIISDVMMPVMDGFKMAGQLKKNEHTSHIPVILLTAKAGQQHKVEGLETGADDYLTKPFDAKELLARIQNLIQQRRLLRKKFAGQVILKPSEIAVNSADEKFLANVMQAIEKNMGEDKFGVEELASTVNMSRSQLHRKLIALTNQAPSEVIRNTRLLRAKELLQKKYATPSEVAFKVGFNSHTYFSKCFKEEFGISPSEIL